MSKIIYSLFNFIAQLSAVVINSALIFEINIDICEKIVYNIKDILIFTQFGGIYDYL